ncbi:MAG: hypothetical protein ABIP48_02575, partial [Planctomycetota bacterium]
KLSSAAVLDFGINGNAFRYPGTAVNDQSGWFGSCTAEPLPGQRGAAVQLPHQRGLVIVIPGYP